MSQRALLALTVCFVCTPLAFAVITAAEPLAVFISSSNYIGTAKVDSFDPEKNTLVLSLQDDIKGKFEFRKINVLIRLDSDAEKLGHRPIIVKRLAPELKTILFVSQYKAELKGYLFTNGSWMQILGTQTEKDRIVWALIHGEPNLRKTFKGTTDELVAVLKDVVAGKAKAPPLDKKVPPGFGPEVPTKSSQFNLDTGGPPFAVIPTVGILGPLAILAILFPAVFGGVLVLFRQWTAFITWFSVNSMLYLLYLLLQWIGGTSFNESWWSSSLAVWTIFTAVTLVCLLWAWRRQLQDIERGVDALETPARTEFIVLEVLMLACVGTLVGTWYLAPRTASGLVWNMTVALTVGVAVGLIYKLYRRISESLLPMATEGMMLGAAAFASIVILVQQTGTAAPSLGSVAGSDATGPQFDRELWRFQSMKDTAPWAGAFASSPLIDGDKVYAASSHAFKFGFVYRFDLRSGKEEWKFGDGKYQRPISSPVVDGGRVYIGEGWHGDPECKVYCIDEADGKKLWEFKTANQTESTPAVENGKVYIGCGNDGFRCLTAGADGKGVEVWRFPTADEKGRLLRFGGAADVVAGRVYVGTAVDRDQPDDPGETAVFCLDANTGKQIWKTPIPFPVWTKPIVNRGQVLVAIGNGNVESDDATPAGAVYCLDPNTGSINWKTDLPNGVLEAPAIEKRQLYVGCRDGNCYAIDRTNGTILWKRDLGSPIIGTPALLTFGKNRTAVIVLSSKGRIACLKSESGEPYYQHAGLESANLRFITAPAVTSWPADGKIMHYVVLAGGNIEEDKPATLICIEGHVPIPTAK